MQRDFGSTFVTQCAPVMAGLKAANLFRWVEPDAAVMAGTLAAWRRQLAPRGVEIETLHFCPRACAYLLYVYRPARLGAILGQAARRATRRQAAAAAAWTACAPACGRAASSRMRSASSSITRWPTSSGLSATGAKIPPSPATGSLTRTPNRRRRSTRGCASAPRSTCAVTAAACRSPG